MAVHIGMCTAIHFLWLRGHCMRTGDRRTSGRKDLSDKAVTGAKEQQPWRTDELAAQRGRSNERACERVSKHCASANADSERQRGGRMSELASESASTVRPRMRTPSASEVAV